jgi:mono/diheme cytochrome c family protein
MLLARLSVALLLVVVVAAAALLAISWRSEIGSIARPDPAGFDPELVAQGAVLSAAGNCMLCHTEEGGAAYAGGYAVETPYGDIYGTNITPDEETGIGTWSEAAFLRSMHEGVDREGRHLYPAFPYTHYTRVTEDDVRAIYAYFMTREPVRAEAPAPEVPFPFTFRPLLAGWKLLFFEEGRFQPAAERDAEWNRGAYLAEGLGHCSACHTPRNALGDERQDRLYDGGEAEGWHGPALNDLAPGPVPWTAEALMAYLREGHHPHHGLAAGPMAPITRELATIPEEDVAAMAVYFDDLTGLAEEAEVEAALAFAREREYEVATLPEATRQAEPGSGAAIFAGACASCHVTGSPVIPFGELTPLALTTAISGPDPRNLIHIILDGIQPPPGHAGLHMPGFAGVLDDRQILALAAYTRERFSNRQPWDDLEERVRQVLDDRDAVRGETAEMVAAEGEGK